MFGKKISLMIALGIAALALTGATASATTIARYDDLASWQAVVSPGAQLVNFENGCLTNCFGASFTGLTGTIGIYDTTAASWINFGTGKAAFINTNSAATPTIRILLPTLVTAFGFNLFTANPNALTFTINTLSNTFSVNTNPTPTPAFFGATSDTAFNFVDVTLSGAPAGAFELIDNFQFGTALVAAPPADPTPEAATFLLIGSGLIGLMGLRKRIMKNKTGLQSNPVLSAC
jgi:hypothetical protein